MREYRVEKGAGSALTPDEMRASLGSEGYRTFEWGDGPGAEYDTHEHATDQSHWIISGSLELNVEGVGTVILEAGDRDLMPAGTRHSARVIGNVPVRYLIGERAT